MVSIAGLGCVFLTKNKFEKKQIYGSVSIYLDIRRVAFT